MDERGSFTEFIRAPERGQVSVNVSKPGITKGNHWHITSGRVPCGERDASISFARSARTPRATLTRSTSISSRRGHARGREMIPGYTHSITNLSDTDDLVTVMWANEPFDPENPDTYYEEV